MLFVDLDELLRVVDLLFEKHEVCHLTNEVVAEADLCEFRCLVKARVVHSKRYDLFVVDNSDELRSCQEGFLVLDRKVVPPIRLELCNEEPV